MKKIIKIGAILCLSSLTGLAFAAQTGAYVGAGLGASKLTTPKQVFEKNTPASLSRDVGGLGERIFAGYNFNKYVGVEAGVAHYAPSKYKATLGTHEASVAYNLNALDVVGKAYLPLSESGFNVYALGGGAYVRSVIDVKASAGLNHDDKSFTEKKIRPVYGVGASYDIPQSSLTTNLELSRIQGRGDVGNDIKAIPSANMLSLNLGYNFG